MGKVEEAIIKILEEEKKPLDFMFVLERIKPLNLIKLDDNSKNHVNVRLGNFIRNGDSRVKRKKIRGRYHYYLTKYEGELNFMEEDYSNKITDNTSNGYKECDLHKLLGLYLIGINNIHSKTILHEKSKNGKNQQQNWVHPDMVGIEFLKLKNRISRDFFKTINREHLFNLISYELKKEINTDYQLKKYFFQAVSNSSWANYGYLVAFEISANLMEEMERLNQSFGVGIILLNSNPNEGKVLFQAKYRKELDFKTIDNLCKINPSFEDFITKVEAIVKAQEKSIKAIKADFEKFCDDCFKNDSEIEHC